MNWGYQTTPQSHLNDRQIDYARGKGLGGSSAINFAGWTVGPRDDYDEWARLVDDESFSWPNARRRLDNIEHFNMKVDDKYLKYYRPLPKDHANQGQLPIEAPPVWEKGLVEGADAVEEFGVPINRDLNSGDPIGLGLFPTTSKDGIRSTAADAFLADTPPTNPKVQNWSPVHKVVFEGAKAVGVEVEGGRYYVARKEIVLCSGALNTPKILMLSGIGPKDELQQHGIECIEHLPGVGSNLSDHLFTTLLIRLKDGIDDRPAVFSTPTAIEAARNQFRDARTGPFTSILHIALLTFQKIPELASDPEFRALPSDVQAHLLRDTVPHFETATHSPPLVPVPLDRSYFPLLLFPFNPQSRGTVRLASADPAAAPLCDANFLAHPFDRAAAVHTVRQGLALLRTPSLEHTFDEVLLAPKSESEEDILEHVRANSGSCWHMTGTARMGRDGEDGMSVVDTRFRVRGVQGLRVADMSVVPFVPNCHTQAWAYQVGAIAAEKLSEEYDLN
ncbi:MAG: hypothetical protein M1821_003819 [Bathelium mastoideum]|nr:MAG: hypothetical protein M1821_003819 [Bathelium mastoideum]